MIDWNEVFAESNPNPPLDAAEREWQLEILRGPLSAEEIADLESLVRPGHFLARDPVV